MGYLDDTGLTRVWGKFKENISSYKTIENTSIATFHDGSNLPLKSLTADITAIQDLHGYDYPWVGGSGRNLFNMGSKWSGTASGLTFTTDNDYVTMNGTKNGGTYVTPAQLKFDLSAGTYYVKTIIIGGTASNQPQLTLIGDDISIGDTIGNERTFTLSNTTTISVRFAFWNDGATFNNYKLGVVISKTSNIDKFYPYSNICPILGWDEVNIINNGIQQWDEEWEVGDIDAQGNPTSSSTLIRTKNYNPCKPNTTYKVVIPNNVSMYMKYYDKDKNFIAPTVSASSTITTPSNCYYFKFVIGSSYGTTYNNDISINYPSTDTLYHAYNGNTYSLTFTDGSNPLIVYWATVELISGVLTVNRVGVDLGTLNYTYTSGQFRAPLSPTPARYPRSGDVNLLCSSYKPCSYAELLENDFSCAVFYASVDGVNIRDSRFTDATAFKTAVSGQQLVYELATPLTYQLSKQQIRSLVGVNNIFADTGAIKKVEYQPDNIVGEIREDIDAITDDKVKQTNTTTDASYNVLFSSSTNTTTEKTEGTRKSANLQFNPNKGALTTGTRASGTVGSYSFTAGQNNIASSSQSIAVGYGNTASADQTFVCGNGNTAAGQYSHVEGKGCSTTSNAWYQHAEGQGSTAGGNAGHAEGCGTVTAANYSHAEGLGTYAGSQAQHVFGKYNTKDTGGTYVEIVGNGTGTADNARSYARRLSWTGNEELAGTLTTTDVTKGSGTWDSTNTSLKDAITAIYTKTLCYSASISRGSGWTQRSTSTAFPSSTTGTYLFMIKDSNGTIYSRMPIPAADFAGTTSTKPLIVRSNGTSSDANNIMAYWSSTTKFYTYAGSSSMPTGTFTLVVHYTPLNI